MKEFILAALPWIIIGLCVAVLAVQVSRKRSKGKDREKKENYMAEGMCIGMCLGVSFQVAIGFDNLGVALCIGMLVGEVIGMMIPKEKQEK